MAISLQTNQRIKIYPRISELRTSRSQVGKPASFASKTQWTYGELLRWTRDTYTAAGLSDPALKAEFYCADFFAKPRLDLFSLFDQPISWNERQRTLYGFQVDRPYYSDIPRRSMVQHEPFLGRLFQVGHSCFVPRPETENLVETGSRFLRERSKLTSDMLFALDTCTGPGCVAISLALANNHVRVHAVDIDPKAVTQTQINIAVHGVATRVRVMQENLFPLEWLAHLEMLVELSKLREEGTRWAALKAFHLESLPRPHRTYKFRDKIHPLYDLIVSNPPYSPTEEVHGGPSFLQFVGQFFGTHQDLARNGGKTGTDVIHAILQEAPRFLKPDGALLIEIGGGQEEEVLTLARSIRFWQSSKILEKNRGRSSVFMASPVANFNFSPYENKSSAPHPDYLSPQRPKGSDYWKRTRRVLTHELNTRLDDLRRIADPAGIDRLASLTAACAAQLQIESRWGTGSEIVPDELEVIRLHIQAIDLLEGTGDVGRHFNLYNLQDREHTFGSMISCATLYVLMEALERKLADRTTADARMIECARFQIQLADDFLSSRRNKYGERLSQAVEHHWRQIEHGLTYYLIHL